MTTTTGVVTRPHGIEIPYTVQGTGAGPRMVFAHGLTGQGAAVRWEIRRLVAAGWTVATYDARGHGAATPVTDPERYALEEIAEDLLAVQEAVGWDRSWVGGGSMGAATALTAALLRPERAEGLLQVAPAIQRDPHPLFHALGHPKHPRSWVVLARALPGFRRLMALERRRSRDMAHLELVEHDPGSVKVAQQVVTKWVIPDFPSCLARLDVPVVIFAWKGDPVHPASVAREMAAHTRECALHLYSARSLKNPDADPGAILRAIEKVAGRSGSEAP